MRPIFDRIRVMGQASGSIFVVNEQGDYLVHPDRTREFAFELGGTDRLQDEFPTFAKTFGASDAEAHIVANAGLALLPELRDRDGTAIPVILYSARSANGHNATQVQAALLKSPASIETLIATLRKQLAGRQTPTPQKREVA